MNNMYKLGGKTIRSLLGIPSGTVAAKASVIELLANTNPGLGFVVTKSINLPGKEGHKAPIYVRRGPGSYINAVGLDNIGAKAFADELSKIKLPRGFMLIVSLFGKTPEEILEAAKILRPYAHAFELNLSCSHSTEYGRVVGQDLELVVKIVEAIVPLGIPVFLKLSARMDVVAIIQRTKGMGIAGYSVTNTLGPEPYEIDGYPVLTNGKGSISGREITEQALDCIKLVRQNTDLEIIGGGGISTGQDVRRALGNGATVCAIGSANTGMSTAQMGGYYRALVNDIENRTHIAEVLLEEIEKKISSGMEYRKFEVAENRALAEDLFLLRFTKEINAGPGQFVFAWVPGKGERPFSVLDANPFSMLVSIRGECTRFMSQLKPGDKVYVRGPHGNIPEVSGKILLVGGGTGVASLYQFAKEYGRNVIAILGAEDRMHLYDAPFRKYGGHIHSFTKDGSAGNHGIVTCCLEDVIRVEKPDFCLNCGPLGMIKAVIPIEERFLPESNVLSSVEFHTDCGVGICGKDATPSGYRPCVDGTFMTKTQLGL
jgi:dihydroorotate dehydrogenase subfamily 1